MHYSFDNGDSLNRNGNTSVTKNGITTNTNYVPNALNQYKSVGGQTLSYDTNLNLSGYQGLTYVYDAQNRMVSATGNGHNAQFAYDGLGRCVRRVIDGTTTVLVYDGWKPIVEANGSGGVVATNVYGRGPDEILSRVIASGSFYFKSDAMGNVRFALNSGGSLVEKYSYDAFGTVTVKDASGNVRPGTFIGNRFLFKGREYLAALGIYDNRKRMYHPGLGVFMQTDPIGFSGDASNLYRFCGHNPMSGSDPMGEDLWDASDWTIDWGGDIDSYYNESDYYQGSYLPEFNTEYSSGDQGAFDNYVWGFANDPLAANTGSFYDLSMGTSGTSAGGGVFSSNFYLGIAASAVTTAEGWFGAESTGLLSNPVIAMLALPFALTGDSGPKMTTLYHYSQVDFTSAVFPGADYTSIPNLTVKQASAGLGIPPPSFQYTVQVPSGSVQFLGPVPASRWGFGGLPWYTSQSPGMITNLRAVPIVPGE